MRWPPASKRSDRGEGEAAGPFAAAAAAVAFRRGSRNDAASMGGRRACEETGAGVLVNEAEGAIMADVAVAVAVSGGCTAGGFGLRSRATREERRTPRPEPLFEPVRHQYLVESS